MKYPRLFSPIKLAEGLELRNRIVMAPMATNFADEFGRPTRNQYAYYRLRARKGVALIVTESNYVREDGKNGKTRMGLHNDDVIPSHQLLTKAVHEEGAKVCAQLHYGGYTISPKLLGHYPLSCSASPLMSRGDNLVGQIPRKMSVQDIKELVSRYADAAYRAVCAGYDAIQIHCAHGYFLNSFLSPHVNKRTDEYGGSGENRMRIVLEIFAAIRGRIGSSFPMTARFTGEESWDGGYDYEYIVSLIKSLEQFNLCEASISGGNWETPQGIAPPYWYKKGTYSEVAGRIKKQIGIPVSTVGRIVNPDIAEAILERGEADLIYIGRELVAFPAFPEAARLGEPIRECLGCNYCFHWMATGDPVRCMANPWVGQDEIIMSIEQNGQPKTDHPRRIAVIGGGPAGLTAATETAKNGHKVDLYEAGEKLGGKLLLAGSLVEGKSSILKLIAYQEHEARQAGVRIHLGRKIESIDELDNPEIVILAAGAVERKISIPGLNKLWSAEQAIGNPNALGENIMIIGGGLVGVEIAEALAERGKKVSIVEMLDDIMVGHELPNKRGQIVKICDLGVWIYTQTQVVGSQNNTLKLKFQEKTFALPFDDVINATGYVSNVDLQNKFTKAGVEVIVLGDCEKPGKIINATHAGLALAKKIN